MAKQKYKSLRTQLSWYLILTMVILTVISGVTVYRGTTHEADEIFDAALVQTARVIDGLVTRETINNNREQLVNAMAKTAKKKKGLTGHKYEKKLFLMVLDHDQKVLLKSHYAPQSSSEFFEPGFHRIQIKSKNWVVFTLEASDDDLLIAVGERDDIREEITEYIASGLVGPLLILLPLVIIVLWQLVRFAFKPMKQVIDEVDSQSFKHLEPIHVDGIPREIAPLVSAINELMENLNSAYTRERRFVSDASHELRNPLASLLINVENAIDESETEDLKDSLQSMKRSITRLSHLTSQLLELSHSETPASNQVFLALDLRQLCNQSADQFQSRAASKQQTIHVEIGNQSCEVYGIEALLMSLISNLLDNAIKYCERSREIYLICALQNDGIIISVEDSGSGIPAEDYDKISQRFYRTNNNLQGPVEGAGLGLSIVKSIADMHSAELLLKNRHMEA